MKYDPSATKKGSPFAAVALLRCSIEDPRLKISSVAINAGDGKTDSI